MLVAIYVRLSKEDDEKQGESESIQNQKSLLIKYSLENNWDIYDIYCDEDFSGADCNRPDFNRLLNDAKEHKFDIILCKTQSRFTRDMELVEKYIHGRFLLWGIRFVSVVDNVDTNLKGNKKARQINGLINEWYLEDLSENIKMVFDHKRRNGYYIGGFPIYGYKKHSTEKGKIVVDPEAAEVVKKIFFLFMAGNGKQRISNILNEQKLPNPTKYKRDHGIAYANGGATDTCGYWSRSTVGRILHEQMYTGDMVQGRTKKISYKSKSTVSVPKSEWIIVPNNHEAIIDRELFDKVQCMMQERTRDCGTGETHILVGKLRCLDCGATMNKYTVGHAKGSRRSYVRCSNYLRDKSLCPTNHAVRLDKLEELVSRKIREYISLYYDKESSLHQINAQKYESQIREYQNEKLTLERNLDLRKKALRDLYLDKTQGIIDNETFRDLNKDYGEEKKRLEDRLEIVLKEIRNLEKSDNGIEALRKKIDCWIAAQTISRELVADFINAIEIGQLQKESRTQEIRINWKI